jgi:hypothetical protein
MLSPLQRLAQWEHEERLEMAADALRLYGALAQPPAQ